jgi:hypothetical protein
MLIHVNGRRSVFGAANRRFFAVDLRQLVASARSLRFVSSATSNQPRQPAAPQ